jgi:hypothetical protein
MKLRLVRPLATVLAIATLSMPATAETAAGATFFAGAEFDDQDGQRFDLGLAATSSGGTRVDLVGSRTETELDTRDLTSTYAFGSLTHDFGRFGLGAGVRHMQDDDFTDTLGLLGMAFVDFASGRLTFSLESRESDFDELPFTLSGEELGLDGVTSASGTATCSVDSLGYGVRLEIVTPGWSFYSSATAFDYSTETCDFEVTSTTGGTTGGAGPGAGRPPIAISRPSIVTGLAAGVTTPLGGYGSTLVPHEAALLESSLMVGANFAAGARTTLGLEFYRDSEQFFDVDTNTVLGYVSFRLTDALGLELTAGVRESDGFENAAFAGLRLSASVSR